MTKVEYFYLKYSILIKQNKSAIITKLPFESRVVSVYTSSDDQEKKQNKSVIIALRGPYSTQHRQRSK